jgi:hypothetical protein
VSFCPFNKILWNRVNAGQGVVQVAMDARGFGVVLASGCKITRLAGLPPSLDRLLRRSHDEITSRLAAHGNG